MNVYGLFDSINNNYFYVGVSKILKKRLSGHMSSTDKNLEKVKVIQNIKANNSRPQIKILEVVPDYKFDDVLKIELGWINRLKKEGHPLTNKALSGGGCKPTKNPKIPISLYIPEETILKFGGKDRIREILYEYIKNYTKPSYE